MVNAPEVEPSISPPYLRSHDQLHKNLEKMPAFSSIVVLWGLYRKGGDLANVFWGEGSGMDFEIGASSSRFSAAALAAWSRGASMVPLNTWRKPLSFHAVFAPSSSSKGPSRL